MKRITIVFQMRVISLLARLDAILEFDSFIGSPYQIHPDKVAAHIEDKLSMLRTIVGMDDWIWDTCGIGRG